jgi:myo-inositol catabolism protein IolH
MPGDHDRAVRRPEPADQVRARPLPFDGGADPVFERYRLQLHIEAHPYDFAERNEDAVQIVRGLNRPWIGYGICIPHAFHLSDGAGDMRAMIEYAGPKLAHVHVADCCNHRAGVGNRYIVNPPGVDARVHQHNEIGHGDIDWDATFAALRDVSFDGIAAVCVFGWEEDADAIHRRMLDRVTSALASL